VKVPVCKMRLLAFTALYLQGIPTPSTLFPMANYRQRLEEITFVLPSKTLLLRKYVFANVVLVE
jgi:hypothetical protein